jgi:hypothetical protein
MTLKYDIDYRVRSIPCGVQSARKGREGMRGGEERGEAKWRAPMLVAKEEMAVTQLNYAGKHEPSITVRFTDAASRRTDSGCHIRSSYLTHYCQHDTRTSKLNFNY